MGSPLSFLPKYKSFRQAGVIDWGPDSRAV
jgi:hypothetical protein